MATKKKAAKKAATKGAAVLRWNPKWIADPAPPWFRNLSPVAQRQIAAAKATFISKVKSALAKG